MATQRSLLERDKGRISGYLARTGFCYAGIVELNQLEWAKAIGRQDLLQKDPATLSEMLRFNRICSRHFATSVVRRKKGLLPDAAPTLCLPGACDDEDKSDQIVHEDILCNNCSNPVVGYRYKCVSCLDYDLCDKCELSGVHSEHYMLRIPKPMKYKFANNLTKKWSQFFNSEHVVPRQDSQEHSSLDSSSDDDQPITKYVKNNDNPVDLGEDVKERIRKEISRVINMKPEDRNKKAPEKPQRKRQTDRQDGEQESSVQKKMKREEEETFEGHSSYHAPEVAFADVNEIKEPQSVELKTEFTEFMPVITSVNSEAHQSSFTSEEMLPLPATTSAGSISDLPPSIPPEVIVTPIEPLNQMMLNEQTMTSEVANAPMTADRPVMHVKLSDDLQELMIEVTSQNQRTIYKYS